MSADNRYRLFVNGTYITSGPSSSNLTNYRYESLDIATTLKLGQNVVAVEVVNFGEYRKAATITFQNALILQGADENDVNIDTDIDNGWKVKKDDGFAIIPFVSDSLRGYYAAGPGERVTGKNHPWGWKSINYTDTIWKEPRAASVEFAVGRGFLYGSTWFLTPRKIPLLREETQRFAKVARSNFKLNDSSFINGTGKLKIPPNQKVSILLDQKKHTIGYPKLYFSKGAESKIKLTYAEALYNKDWKKGNRNDIKGKTNFRLLRYCRT